MKAFRLAILVCLCGCGGAAAPAEFQKVDTKIHHLRSGAQPEWEEFAGRFVDGRTLATTIQLAEAAAGEATLFLFQENVKHRWPVQLNGKALGALVTQDEPLVSAFAVPAGTLVKGQNSLEVLSPKEGEDVLVGVVRLEPRPLAQALGECTIVAGVTEPGRGRIPARITVEDETRNALMALRTEPSPTLASRPGVVYTGTGIATFTLPAGRYALTVSRGFEYGIDRKSVSLEPGQSRTLDFEIKREVMTPHLVSCDPHVHVMTNHGDCTLEERLVTVAGEGLEVPVATEHNRHLSYHDAAAKSGLNRWFTPMNGNEVTTRKAHWNIFPVPAGAAVPDQNLDGDALMKSIRATGAMAVVLNHPRSVHTNFVPFGPGSFDAVVGDLPGVPAGFDAIELLNSGALRTDFMEVFRDWFTLLNRGRRVVGVGTSDSHDVSRFVVGQGRTYLACPDEDPGAIDVGYAVKSLVEGRAHPSLGLLATIRVADRYSTGDVAKDLPDEFPVKVSVWGPSWTHVDRVELFANGVAIKSEEQAGARVGGEKLAITWKIRKPAHDVHLVAVASGPAERQLHWPMPRPYQPSSPKWTPRWVGATNPVWIDADNDGRSASAREIAEQLVARLGMEPDKLLPGLSACDEAVAVQAAALLVAAGKNLRATEWTLAPDAVRRAFAAVAASR